MQCHDQTSRPLRHISLTNLIILTPPPHLLSFVSSEYVYNTYEISPCNFNDRYGPLVVVGGQPQKHGKQIQELQEFVFSLPLL